MDDRSLSYYDYTLNAWVNVDSAHPLPTTGGGGGGGSTVISGNDGTTNRTIKTDSSGQIIQAPITNASAAYTKGAYNTQTGSIINNGDTLFGAVDAIDYQSVSVQLDGTWTGTISFQVSDNGTSWVSKLLTKSDNTQGSSTTGNAIFFGDIGARYFRATATATMTGTANLTALYSALSSNVQGQSTLSISNIGNVGHPHAIVNDTSTTLGAGATFTGTTRDLGTTLNLYAGRVRAAVTHTAGLTPGTLVFQQSVDGTTWFETARTPVPSDGMYHTFEFSLINRYYRWLFINGGTAQTAFGLRTLQFFGEGAGVEMERNLNFPLSATALGASATYNSATLDLGANHSWDRVRAMSFSDQASTLTVQQSKDNTNWRNTRPNDAGLGATVSGTAVAQAASVTEWGEWKIVDRYIRIVYVNTTVTAQTVTQVDATLVTL